ncbi:MAG: amidohydrolase [Chitinophagia bacterium]|jgi:amidohydrolase|nr:amidohydrolase [Chitinophagia bacterium]
MKKIFVLILALVSIQSFAQSPWLTVIDTKAKAIQPKLVEWRRHIHQNPELGNREVKTQQYIANHLRSLGIEVKLLAKTGVLGVLVGGKPGPVIALRADIDGLPVKERVDVPYKSNAIAEYQGNQVPVMHACGHDTHTSILMGTAEVLASMKKDIAGTVKFFFQPAEEGPPADEEGGAPLMIKEGVMDNPKVDAVFGLHIASSLEIGKIKYKSGSMMASSDWFTIKIKGKQTHGSTPWTGIDPIVVGTQIINNLQTIVSRQEDLTIAPVVITVGKFHSGVRANIIPETAELEGTIRTLDSKMQKDVHEKMRLVAKKVGEAWGAEVDINIETKTLVTYNDPALVAAMVPSLEKAAGKDNVTPGIWTTGAEDFSFFGEKAPAFFFNLGGMPKGIDPAKAAPHHTPDFYIDDSMLDVGVKAFCNIVFDFATKKK